ncbi:MAG: DJ-1/PfpI family protein [Candidatus Cloacimonadota bacterium]|nr:MAG: DJ-1/PfpI family protein [Candidatus Cloacimonadota bacterium]
MNWYLVLLLILPLLFNSCQGGEDKKMEDKKEPSLAGEKILMVIAPQNFRDEEFEEPHSLFLSEGANVVVASTDTNEAKGMLGMKVKPDKLIEDVTALDFDAIVLIGGSGSTILWDNEKLHELLKSAYENKKIIGAICLSPVTLVKAGILKGKSATCYETPDVVQIFKENEVELTKKTVEVTEKIVTANGPPAAKDYAEKIVELLK